MKQFSKKLLALDYIITAILLITFFICIVTNGIYTIQVTAQLISNGLDAYSITMPFDLDVIGIIIATWATQLGVSSAAYYMLIKSEHKIELPIRLLDDLPDDIKEQIDLTQVITTVLTSTDN